MSLPHNLQPSPQFIKCGDGRSRQLLFYEASIMNILKGPMVMLGSSLSNMLQYMLMKAQSPEEQLLVKMLFEKSMAEYITVVGGLLLVVDNKFDVKAEIDKAFAEVLKRKGPAAGGGDVPSDTSSVPKPEPPD